jgi:hypothetical protein
VILRIDWSVPDLLGISSSQFATTSSQARPPFEVINYLGRLERGMRNEEFSSMLFEKTLSHLSKFVWSIYITVSKSSRLFTWVYT